MAGFTLLELLLYAGLCGVVLWMAVSAVVSNVRSNSSMLRSLRITDRWGRLSTLLDTEIAEGITITYSNILPQGCGSGALDGGPAVTVTIPYLTAGNQIQYSAITYFTQGGTFFRCGPPFSESGRLSHDQTSVLSPISTRTSFVVDTSSTGGRDPSRSLSYTVQFRDASGAALFTRSATARTRVRLVQ